MTDRLVALEPVKTWSLIATVFGDLAAPEVSGKDLKALLAPLGIKPEAMRVALHRLKKDGWITSTKSGTSGREVQYHLSDRGRAETLAAREDIYRRDVKYPEGWRLVALPPDSDPPSLPHLAIDRTLFLMPTCTALPDHALPLHLGTSLPDWFEARLVPAHLHAQASKLVELAAAFEPAAEDSASARLMFLHLWRKMALRLGTWAHIGLFPGGAMAQCHSAMADIFDQTSATRPKSSDPRSVER